MTREEAARALGVTVGADPEDCKRAYRRLALEHHPDVGGDPQRFHTLQEAYERLVADGRPEVPVVSRGTPSRPHVAFVDGTEVADTDSFRWDVSFPQGRVRLDRDRAGAWLAAPARDGAVRPLVATSRAPGSRLNGLAHLLSPEFTSRLTVRDTVDDRGRRVVAIELVGGNGRARRALDRVAVHGGSWVRTRRSTTTMLRSTLDASLEPRGTAARATDRLVDLLEELGWPLGAWTLERP